MRWLGTVALQRPARLGMDHGFPRGDRRYHKEAMMTCETPDAPRPRIEYRRVPGSIYVHAVPVGAVKALCGTTRLKVEDWGARIPLTTADTMCALCARILRDERSR